MLFVLFEWEGEGDDVSEICSCKQSRWKHEAKRSASICLALGEHCPEFPIAAVGTID